MVLDKPTPDPQVDFDLEARLSKFKQDSTDVQQEQSTLGQDVLDVFGEINVGLAQTLGIFVDPFTDPGFVQNKLAEMNWAPPYGEESQSFGGRVAQGAGNALPMFLSAFGAGARIAGTVERGGEAVSPLAKMALETFRSPRKMALLETASIITSVAGGMVGEDLTGHSTWGRALGELLGGLTPAGINGVLSMKAKTVGHAKHRFTHKQRTTRRIEDVAERNLDQSKRNIDSATLDLPPAERTGDAGIMALQNAAAEEVPTLSRKIAEREARAYRQARRMLLRDGNAKNTRQYLESLVLKTVADVRKSMRRLTPNFDAKEANTMVRSYLDDAYNQAREMEVHIWRQVPDAPVDIAPVQNAYIRLLQEQLPESNKGNIPGYIRQIIGDFAEEGGKVTFEPGILTPRLRNIHELRGRILEDLVKERSLASPNRKKLRILGELQDAMLESLKDSGSGDQFTSALDYSATLNKKFTKGFVGDLRGYERSGELSYIPAETLDKLMTMTGERQGAALQQVLDSAPKSKARIADAVKHAFLSAATDDDGSLVVKDANKFLKKNKTLLDEFPEIRAHIEQSVDSQKIVNEMLGERQPALISPIRKRISTASLYLDAPIGQEIDRVMNRSISPSHAMKELVRLTAGDEKATAGLRTAVKEYMLNEASSDKLDALGNRIILGSSLVKNIRKNMVALKQVLPAGEITRLKIISRELLKIEKAQSAGVSRGGVIHDAPNIILDFLARVVGAGRGVAIGKQLGISGPASLLTAQFGSKRAREFLTKLTNDKARELLLMAMEDPEVLKTILTDVSRKSSPEAAKIMDNVLGWMTIPLVTAAGKREPGQKDDDALQRRLNKMLEDTGAQ